MKKVYILTPIGVIILALICLYLAITPIFVRLLSSNLGLIVGIERVDLWPTNITFNSFTIPNLAGLKEPLALSVRKIAVDAPLTHYLKQVTEIDKVELNDIFLVVEFYGRKGSRNNWSTMMDSINSSDNTTTSNQNSYAEIKELRITNLKVRIIKDGKTNDTVIPEIVLRNVKTKNGELMKRLTSEILYQMIFNVQNLIKIPMKIAEDALKQSLPPGVPDLLFPK